MSRKTIEKKLAVISGYEGKKPSLYKTYDYEDYLEKYLKEHKNSKSYKTAVWLKEHYPNLKIVYEVFGKRFNVAKSKKIGFSFSGRNVFIVDAKTLTVLTSYTKWI